MNIVEALHYGESLLTVADSPQLDSQHLLCHVLGCRPTYLHTWPDKIMTDEQQAGFKQLIAQRKKGQPVAYLVGQCGFWTLDLKVTADTLIPRPDTELLVSLALEKMQPDMIVADLGTGSGAVALAIAAERPMNNVFAMDCCLQAINVAQYNAEYNHIANVIFWQGNWLSAVRDNGIDMVVSNPPYIKEGDWHLSQGDVRFEPLGALASGTDGLMDIRRIIKQARRCLKPSGWLLIEHGYQQADAVQAAFVESGFIAVKSYQDFGGNDRVVAGQLTV